MLTRSRVVVVIIVVLQVLVISDCRKIQRGSNAPATKWLVPW
jgi:hypothetical protein